MLAIQRGGGSTYIEKIDFLPVSAQHARIKLEISLALGRDNMNARRKDKRRVKLRGVPK
jgi:hypothetical protein